VFKSYHQNSPPGPEALRHKAALEHRLKRLVALADEKVIGTVQYYPIDGRLHLIGLAVHPDYQRRGVARRMVETLCCSARLCGVGKLSLFTSEDRGLVPVLERLGFVAVSDEPNPFVAEGELSRDVYMERAL
jgi:ribosomal protein S18 acetylase RimI-like enzyme